LPYFKKKFPFCLDTKRNKKIKGKTQNSFKLNSDSVLPVEKQKFDFEFCCDLLSNFYVS
jgi:hypothetical protein